MRRAWITESTLCSALKECGTVPSKVSRYCVESYLRQQLSILPHAVVATLGTKAQKRVQHLERELGREFIHAFSVAPPCCNFSGAKESWQQIAAEVRKRKQAGIIQPDALRL
jgi:uracil-DNA glycosylase